MSNVLHKKFFGKLNPAWHKIQVQKNSTFFYNKFICDSKADNTIFSKKSKVSTQELYLYILQKILLLQVIVFSWPFLRAVRSLLKIRNMGANQAKGKKISLAFDLFF